MDITDRNKSFLLLGSIEKLTHRDLEMTWNRQGDDKYGDIRNALKCTIGVSGKKQKVSIQVRKFVSLDEARQRLCECVCAL